MSSSQLQPVESRAQGASPTSSSCAYDRRVEVTNYSRRQHGDPDVEVGLTVDGHEATGFIDARRQVDGVWHALVDYSYPAENGFPSHRSDWFPMDQLTVLTVNDVPVES